MTAGTIWCRCLGTWQGMGSFTHAALRHQFNTVKKANHYYENCFDFVDPLRTTEPLLRSKDWLPAVNLTQNLAQVLARSQH